MGGLSDEGAGSSRCNHDILSPAEDTSDIDTSDVTLEAREHEVVSELEDV